MCARSYEDTPAGDLESTVWSLYGNVVSKLSELDPTGLPELTLDGSQPMHSNGQPSLPSPSDMEAIAASISWVIESLKTSGKLPDADQLFSFVQSSAGGPVACTITACSTVLMISCMVLVSSGEHDSVLQILKNMTGPEAPRPIWRNTLPRNVEEKPSGISSITPLDLTVEETIPDPHTSSLELVTPTTHTSRGKKRRSRGKTRTVSASGKGSKKKPKKKT